MSRQPVIMVVPPGVEGTPSRGLPRWGQPPGILTHLAAKLWLLGLIYATSDVVDHPLLMMLLLIIGTLLAVRWAAAVLFNLLGTLAGRISLFSVKRVQFLVVPLIFTLAFFAWQYRPGLYLRLLWSAAPLQAFVEFEGREFPPEDAGRWVGLFQIYDVDSQNRRLLIRTTPLSEGGAGLAFVESGAPSSSESETLHHLYGSWWAWYPDPAVKIPHNISGMGEWLEGYASSARSLTNGGGQ